MLLHELNFNPGIYLILIHELIKFQSRDLLDFNPENNIGTDNPT